MGAVNLDRFPGVTGALLAGGASRRMGADKAMLPVDGQPMGQRALAVLSTLFDEVLVVENLRGSARPPWPAPARVVFDPPDAARSALTGIRTALESATHPWVFVLACDVPFASVPLIRGMCTVALHADPPPKMVVPRTGTLVHPLVAVYHRDLLGEVSTRIQQGIFRVQELAEAFALFVEEGDLKRWDPNLSGLVNINTPEELQMACTPPPIHRKPHDLI